MFKPLPPKIRGDAFTLVEVLVAAAILLILVALLFSGMTQWLERSKAPGCLNNVRLMSSAFRLWWTDHGGNPPPYDAGYNNKHFEGEIIANYLPNGKSLRCPLVPNIASRENPYGFRYGFNRSLMMVKPNWDYRSLANLPVPQSRVVLVAENYATEFWSHTHLNNTIRNTFPGNEKARNIKQMHSKGLHLGFLDGHAKLVVPTDEDWGNKPIRGDETNGGYYYTEAQFRDMHKWNLNKE